MFNVGEIVVCKRPYKSTPDERSKARYTLVEGCCYIVIASGREDDHFFESYIVADSLTLNIIDVWYHRSFFEKL